MFFFSLKVILLVVGRLEVLRDAGPQGRRAVVVISRLRDVENIWHNGYFGSLVQSRYKNLYLVNRYCTDTVP